MGWGRCGAGPQCSVTHAPAAARAAQNVLSQPCFPQTPSPLLRAPGAGCSCRTRTWGLQPLAGTTFPHSCSRRPGLYEEGCLLQANCGFSLSLPRGHNGVQSCISALHSNVSGPQWKGISPVPPSMHGLFPHSHFHDSPQTNLCSVPPFSPFFPEGSCLFGCHGGHGNN